MESYVNNLGITKKANFTDLMSRYCPVLVGLTVLISACTLDNINDPQLPFWMTRLDIPLTSKTITFADILPDSMVSKIPYDENGETILYAFQDTIPVDSIFFDMEIMLFVYSGGAVNTNS